MRRTYKGLRMGLTAAAAVVFAIATPAVAHSTPQEAANKKVVLDFYAALNAADAAGTTPQQADSIIKKYLGPTYYQHSEMFRNMPGPGTDRDKLIRMFQSMPAGTGPRSVQKTDAVMAEGDLVMLLTSRDTPDPATGKAKTAYVFNMFRVKNGQLIEHWDISPAMGGAPGGGAGAPPVGAGSPSPGAFPPPGFPPRGAN